MFWSRKHGQRREVVRQHRPDRRDLKLERWRSQGVFGSVGIAAVFFIAVSSIIMMREAVVAYRPGQYIAQDIQARVDFTFTDPDQLTEARNAARQSAPRVYTPTEPEHWETIQKTLDATPDRLAGLRLDEVPKDYLQMGLDEATRTEMQECGLSNPALHEEYEKRVAGFLKEVRALVIVSNEEYADEMASALRQFVLLPSLGNAPISRENLYPVTPANSAAGHTLVTQVQKLANAYFRGPPFKTALEYPMRDFVLANIAPTFKLDEQATTESQNAAAKSAASHLTETKYTANQVLVSKGRTLTEKQWNMLRKEKAAFIASLGVRALKPKIGYVGVIFLLTVGLSIYIGHYQPRVIENHTRGIAIAALLLTTLLLAMVSAIGTGPLYVFGVAPTILVAMILAIAYDRRFAMGIATLHAVMVTLAVAPSEQALGFFIILESGVLTTCFFLNEVRTRSKPIEVGGISALAMMGATIATGAISLDPIAFIWQNCLYTGAAGLGNGFVVLGILPFIEKAFKITTAMTLLEVADASQPLLRRLATEAPGTYNHSLQVAALSEAAAEAIGANSLLCRVGSYYHDIGKINKPDYFIENQTPGGESRHLHLSPSVSLLVIIGHVKDGVALAREYNLPPTILPIIQQHHGTTLVEYFYHRACVQELKREADSTHEAAAISETQYRYPGPKPQRKEAAIVMLADAVESAARTMPEPTAARIGSLVRDIAAKRLEDGQFDHCEITLSELHQVELALMKALTGIYHGRIAYPSTAKFAQSVAPETPSGPHANVVNG